MKLPIFMLLIGVLVIETFGQKKPEKVPDTKIQQMVEQYKGDARGPYRDIRWFCKDGSTVSPQERCPEPGVQRARYKDEVVALGESNHIFLGQILSTTPIEAFWDASHQGSRMKQYSLEQYLRANDNGWINRKAQFYRGAFQAEDEEAWGIAFLQNVLEDRQRISDHFFLIRQSAKDIPHAGDNNTAQNVRALSKEISDVYNPFMDLRVKLHGQPEPTDIQRVQDFREAHISKLNKELNDKFELLLQELDVFFQPVDINDFKEISKRVPRSSSASSVLLDFMNDFEKSKPGKARSQLLARTAWSIRTEISTPMKSSARLALIDTSIKIEALLNQESGTWKPKTLEELMSKTYTLSMAAAGFGYLEEWEWTTASDYLEVDHEELALPEFGEYVEHCRRYVEWSSATFRANYQDIVNLYTAFEPMAGGFIDDRVRASILLPLGSSVSLLGDLFAKKAGFSNSIMDIANPSSARGLNPGYAKGELVVTNQNPEDIEVSSEKIYVFNRPPADLKPVAGIATVTEGNLVSHVQLLARNLGIPNAVLSTDNLNALLPYNGEMVFFAVSNKGTVIMKPASEMTETENALFTSKVRSEEKISVPVEQMQLDQPEVLNLREVNAASSGIICGPKAANLGQLKKLFPDHVVEGIVIPFSIFKLHFDQQIPGRNTTYWEYLKATFDQAEAMKQSQSEVEVEAYVLKKLDTLRDEIKKISFTPAFEAALKQKFKEVLGGELGKVPVFIRSDTNMEDLKDFTGAGLNLTLFNVLDAQKILMGIKEVWASPYTERSYKWRQSYLLNPENVFPSILIIPSVNADCSGVLITKGVTSGRDGDLTVAFNRGVGGAVEGQASETWLLKESGSNVLLSPAREPEYMSIPVSGGTVKKHTGFKEVVLNENKLEQLRSMATQLKDKLPETGLKEPYDVELGFKGDQLWLFQVRPFVENKRAAASEYLRSITPALPEKTISLDSSI